jgi:hypothetical protein
MRAVRIQASSLLRASTRPVLVVYGEQDARIYYESEPLVKAPLLLRKPATH